MKIHCYRDITFIALATATVVIYIGLAQPANAGVVWLASDNGTDLILTTDGGSLDIGSLTATSPQVSPGSTVYLGNSTAVYTLPQSFYWHNFAGFTPNNPWITSTANGTGTGDSFGHNGPDLIWDAANGTSPSIITPSSTMIFPGLTVATAFGTNLNAGPVTIFELNNTGDTISVALVPEPSSTLFLSLGGLAAALRRKRAS